MSIFEPIEIEWDGRTFTIPSNQVLPAIQILEDTLRGPKGEHALTMLMLPGGPGMARMGSALAAVIRYAQGLEGVSRKNHVKDDEVVNYLIEQLQDDEGYAAAGQVAMSLLSMVSPPAASKLRKAAEDAEKKMTELMETEVMDLEADLSRGSTASQSG